MANLPLSTPLPRSCDLEYNTLDHNYCFTSLVMTFLELQTLWQCMGETFWTCRSYQAIYPMARELGCLVDVTHVDCLADMVLWYWAYWL